MMTYLEGRDVMVQQRVAQSVQRGAAVVQAGQRRRKRRQLLQRAAAAAQRAPRPHNAGCRPLDPFADFFPGVTISD